MALHHKLDAFSKEKNIGRFSGILKIVEKELLEVNVTDWDVTVSQISETSIWRRLYTTDVYKDVEQSMIVQGVACGYPFTFVNPMALGILLPYTLHISLPIPSSASMLYTRGFCGLYGKWQCNSEDKSIVKEVAKIDFPSVAFNHSWGGVKYYLPATYAINPDANNNSNTDWSITSGYQGFIFGVGPRLAKYIRMASQLETVLASLSNSKIRVAPIESDSIGVAQQQKE